MCVVKVNANASIPICIARFTHQCDIYLKSTNLVLKSYVPGSNKQPMGKFSNFWKKLVLTLLSIHV